MEVRTKRFLGCACGCLAPPLLLVLIVAGGLQWWLSSSRTDTERLLDEARASGQPINDVELADSYHDSLKRQDVTGAFWKLTEPWTTEQYKLSVQPLKIVSGGFDFPKHGELFRESDDSIEFLNSHRQSLDQLYALAQRENSCRFDLRDPKTGNQHIERLDSARRLALLEGVIAARFGDADTTARSIMTQFWLAEVMRNEPSALAQTMGGVHYEITCQFLADTLPHVEFSDEQFDQFAAEIRRFDSALAMRRTLYGERALGLQFFSDPSMLLQDPALVREINSMADVDRNFFVTIMTRMIEIAELPPKKRFEQATSIQREAVQQCTTMRGRLGYSLSRIILPSLQSVAATPIHSEAIGRAALVAMEVERFRRQKGVLPDSLDDLKLANDVKLDPLNEQPLALTRDESTIEIRVTRAELDHEAFDGSHDDHDGHNHEPPVKATVTGDVLTLRYD